MKSLIEVEFVGPEADKGAEVLVKESQQMSAARGGIPMPGVNCKAVNYSVVNDKENVVVNTNGLFKNGLLAGLLVGAIVTYIGTILF